ncbi:MAG: prepilin-type N-terminal cleavage/methylation domain-containing protein [Meiothermus sp.]|nr:prepilin-type N-terminal cleavage/methylation domain-containing protein [Meiothermus sp.]
MRRFGVGWRGGMTMLELLVVLGMLGIIFGIAFVNLRPLSNPLQNGVAQTSAFLRQVRTKAMSTTSAYRVYLLNNTTLVAEYAYNCAGAGAAVNPDPGPSGGAWRYDRGLRIELQDQVQFVGSSQALLCFSSRGQSDTALELSLRNPQSQTRTVRVLLAGGIEVQ